MADQITFTNKTNNRTLPTISADQKVSAADMNEVKTVVNTNADELDTTTALSTTNQTNIATNAQAITDTDAKFLFPVGLEAGTELRLDRVGGRRWGNNETPDTNTVFTFATSGQYAPVSEGFARIVTSEDTEPDWGYTVDYRHWANDAWTSNSTKTIDLFWLDSKLHAFMLGSPISTLPASNEITDITSYVGWWDSTNLNQNNNVGISNGQEMNTVLPVSGSINLTAPSGSGPTYNSTNQSLVFDGTDDYLANITTGVSAQPYTWAVVYTPRTGIGNADGIVGMDDAGAGPLLTHRIDGTNFVRANAGTGWTDNVSVTLDSKILIIVTFDGVNTAIYKNGNVTAEFTGDIGSNGPNGKIIWGALTDAATPGFPAPIDGYDLMLFSDALSGADLTTVRDTMVQKHSL